MLSFQPLSAAVRVLGWVGCVALFGTLLSSLLHVPFVGIVPELLLALLVAVTVVRPDAGLAITAAIVPFATVVALRYWSRAVLWPLPVACAVLAGGGLNALTSGRRTLTNSRLVLPAVAFGAIVVAALAAAFSAAALPLGQAFAHTLRTQLTETFFVDIRTFPALHAGLRLLEGIVLCVLAARTAAARRGTLRLAAAGLTAGAVICAALTAARLHGAAARSPAYWSSLAGLVRSLRWNVAFSDMNAAGSYFLLAGFLAVGLARTEASTSRRAVAAAAACAAFVALWLTGSRAALMAAGVATMVTIGLRLAGRSRDAMIRIGALAAAGLVLAVVLAFVLPKKGAQVSSATAADVRVELARTSARMMATHPAFGIGLGEFIQRSGEFSSPELLATFPPAVHENAHNNFLQIAAELGPAGGIAFVWLVCAALWLAAPWRRDDDDVMAAWAWTGLLGFVLTWLGGHPLLVPETAFPFWIVLGAAAGTGVAGPAPRYAGAFLTAFIAVLAATLPLRFEAARRELNLEHVGVGVSLWQTAGDSERYRSAEGEATLFVPAGMAFKLRVKPLSSGPVPLVVELDGRVADRVILLPGVWNDLRIPRRTQRPDARYAALHLAIDAPSPPIEFRVTKVEPLGSGS